MALGRRSSLFPFAVAALGLPGAAHASWPVDTRANLAVCAALLTQSDLAIAPDGTGGAILAWADLRIGTTQRDIYVQRLARGGYPKWAADGVQLTTSAATQAFPAVVTDGAGGAIVTWTDDPDGTSNLYAQRVDAAGRAQWSSPAAVCEAAGKQGEVRVIDDGAGGAIVAWTDLRTGLGNVYAQRVDASGTPRWGVDGLPVCTATGEQRAPALATDGAGGAILAWADARNLTDYDLYVQRVSAGGVPLWTPDGLPLAAEASAQSFPVMVSDGAGGAIVAWVDARTGPSYDVYAGRVAGDGAMPWAAGGVALCTAPDDQFGLDLASDGAGGAIVTWYDYRSGVPDIYAERVVASGQLSWSHAGVVCAAPLAQQSPSMVTDGKGGAIVAWYDYRSGEADIYAQRLGVEGESLWGPGAPAVPSDGVVVSNAPGAQLDPVATSDGAGGVIVAWLDYRSPPWTHVYAQHMTSAGLAGEPLPSRTSLLSLSPNPVRDVAALTFALPDPAVVTLTVFDLAGRRRRVIPATPFAAGESEMSWSATDDSGRRMEPGVYFARLEVGGSGASTTARFVVLP